MSITALIRHAHSQGASDLHLESGMPPAMRIRGKLRIRGEVWSASQTLAAARQLVSEADWERFYERRSVDLSRRIGGVRCRINIFQTARGTGLAIRLFSSFSATVDTLNLHPTLKSLIEHSHGLVLICGPTGSGKSTTIAALIAEINVREARHILTIEQPIEYELRPRLSYIRQREVGRDTPSFEQALIDALREDPDVLMVGEVRRPETMRLTLAAAETGHLVLTSVHSSTASEAVSRIISAFPPEIQSSVSAQLAECLVAVVCQRLAWSAAANMVVPECEIMVANTAIKACIRQGQLHRIPAIIETGRADGMWSRAQYRRWLEEKTDWRRPPKPKLEATEDLVAPPPVPSAPRRPPAVRRPAPASDGVIVLDGIEENPDDILF
ncbi:MAG: twitching motility protein PilT [Myxococcota bacterium]|jgi:twitching motility protein PilT